MPVGIPGKRYRGKQIGRDGILCVLCLLQAAGDRRGVRRAVKRPAAFFGQTEKCSCNGCADCWNTASHAGSHIPSRDKESVLPLQHWKSAV